MNKVLIITGRIGKTHLANAIAGLFQKDEVYKTVLPLLTMRRLRYLSNKFKLVIIDQCDEQSIINIYKQGKENPFNCNLLMCSRERIFDDFNSNVTVFDL